MTREAAYAALVDAVDELTAHPQVERILSKVVKAVEDVVSCDRAELALYCPALHAFRIEGLVGTRATTLPSEQALVPVESATGWTHAHARPNIRSSLRRQCLFPEDALYRDEGLGRLINLPLGIGNQCLGALNLASRSEGPVEEDDLTFLMKVARFLALTVHLLPAVQPGALEPQPRAVEDRYLDTLAHPSGLVYVSAAMQHVMQMAERVAATRATVLITGESGTGKELLARAIHEMGRRATKPLICVNCGALPQGLVESVLFGHERGAFTGALTRHLGCFQQAHGGTLFLDEVAELSLEVQVTLLRVLQDRRVQRVGGTEVIPVDVRIVAATNTDLQVAVSEQRFRADLYHRLNVFPIQLPPLRERPEDVSVLARYFAREHGKELTDAAVRRLREYWWPGNVRELQNFIERAAILSDAHVLDLADLPFSAAAHDSVPMETNAGDSRRLLDIERQHIIRTLCECAWQIEGRQGAARQLGLHPSTLRSRLKKMGIHRPLHPGPLSASL